MAKIILSTPVTLDGFIEGPHRELDWVVADDDLHDFYADLLANAELIIYGRITYELMVSYWPIASTDPHATPGMLRFAEALNPKPKLVYSTTLQNAGWNTRVEHQILPDEILKLKAEVRGNILLGGGASLAHTFIQHGLIDEIQLVLQPTAIGAGKPLFQGLEQGLKLKYQWNHPFPSGAVALSYLLDRKA
jgi:dihydrofolate reductase